MLRKRLVPDALLPLGLGSSAHESVRRVWEPPLLTFAALLALVVTGSADAGDLHRVYESGDVRVEVERPTSSTVVVHLRAEVPEKIADPRGVLVANPVSIGIGKGTLAVATRPPLTLDPGLVRLRKDDPIDGIVDAVEPSEFEKFATEFSMELLTNIPKFGMVFGMADKLGKFIQAVSPQADLSAPAFHDPAWATHALVWDPGTVMVARSRLAPGHVLAELSFAEPPDGNAVIYVYFQTWTTENYGQAISGMQTHEVTFAPCGPGGVCQSGETCDGDRCPVDGDESPGLAVFQQIEGGDYTHSKTYARECPQDPVPCEEAQWCAFEPYKDFCVFRACAVQLQTCGGREPGDASIRACAEQVSEAVREHHGDESPTFPPSSIERQVDRCGPFIECEGRRKGWDEPERERRTAKCGAYFQGDDFRLGTDDDDWIEWIGWVCECHREGEDRSHKCPCVVEHLAPL